MKVLTINHGTSSLKFSLYDFSTGERRIAAGKFATRNALESIANLEASRLFDGIDGLGHRVVHGGGLYFDPVPITTAVLEDLKRLVPLAPNHLPAELALIAHLRERFPELVQVACFDTAFHRTLPNVARRLPLSPEATGPEVLRYGFHGLSCEYIVDALQSNGRVVIAHLGSGSSVTAVFRGRSVDTTMGLTPLGGTMMATRPGDLDPGVLLYLLREKKIPLERLEKILDEESGLLGVSGLSADMETLLSQMNLNERAREAVELYCYSARKAIGALAAALGGVDCLVFTGGIGEHSPWIREKICEGLACLGISPDRVHVIPANEEVMIARKTRETLLGRGAL